MAAKSGEERLQEWLGCFLYYKYVCHIINRYAGLVSHLTDNLAMHVPGGDTK